MQIREEKEALNKLKYKEYLTTADVEIIHNMERLDKLNTQLKKFLNAQKENAQKENQNNGYLTRFKELLVVELFYLMEQWLYPLEKEARELRKEIEVESRDDLLEKLVQIDANLLEARLALGKTIVAKFDLSITKNNFSHNTANGSLNKVSVIVNHKKEHLSIEQFTYFKKFTNEPRTQQAFVKEQKTAWSTLKKAIPGRFFHKYTPILDDTVVHNYNNRGLRLPNLANVKGLEDKTNLYLDDTEKAEVWFYKLRRHLHIRETLNTRMANYLTSCNNLLNGCVILKQKQTENAPLGEFNQDHFFADIIRAESKLEKAQAEVKKCKSRWFIGQKNQALLSHYETIVKNFQVHIANLKKQKAIEVKSRLQATLNERESNKEPVLSEASFKAYQRFAYQIFEKEDGKEVAEQFRKSTQFNQHLIKEIHSYLENLKSKKADQNQAAEATILVQDIADFLAEKQPSQQLSQTQNSLQSNNSASRRELVNKLRDIAALVKKYQPEIKATADRLVLICDLSEDMDDYSDPTKATQLLKELAQFLRVGSDNNSAQDKEAEALLNKLAKDIVFPALFAERNLPSYEFFKAFKGHTDGGALDDLFSAAYDYLSSLIDKFKSPSKNANFVGESLTLLKNSNFNKFKDELKKLEKSDQFTQLAFSLQFLMLTAAYHRNQSKDETISKLIANLTAFIVSEACDFTDYQKLMPVISYFLAPNVYQIAGPELLEEFIFKSLRHLDKLQKTDNTDPVKEMLAYVNAATTDHRCYLTTIFTEYGYRLASFSEKNKAYLIARLNSPEFLQDISKIQFVWQIVSRCQNKRQQIQLLSEFKTQLLKYLLTTPAVNKEQLEKFTAILGAIDKQFSRLSVDKTRQFTPAQEKILEASFTKDNCSLANLELVKNFIGSTHVLQHVRTTVLVDLFEKDGGSALGNYQYYLTDITNKIGKEHDNDAQQIGDLKQAITKNAIENRLPLLDLVDEHIGPAELRALAFIKALRHVFEAEQFSDINAYSKVYTRVENLLALASSCPEHCKAAISALENLNGYVGLPPEKSGNLFFKYQGGDHKCRGEIYTNDGLFKLIADYFPAEQQAQAAKNAMGVYLAYPNSILEKDEQYKLIEKLSSIKLSASQKLEFHNLLKTNFDPEYFSQLYQLTDLIDHAAITVKFTGEDKHGKQATLTQLVDLKQAVINIMLDTLLNKAELKIGKSEELDLDKTNWLETFAKIYEVKSDPLYEALTKRFEQYLINTPADNHYFNQLIKNIGTEEQKNRVEDSEREAAILKEQATQERTDASTIAVEIHKFLAEVTKPARVFNERSPNRDIELIGKKRTNPIVYAAKEKFFELLGHIDTSPRKLLEEAELNKDKQVIAPILCMANNLTAFAKQMQQANRSEEEKKAGIKLQRLINRAIVFNSASLLNGLRNSELKNKAQYFAIIAKQLINYKMILLQDGIQVAHEQLGEQDWSSNNKDGIKTHLRELQQQFDKLAELVKNADELEKNADQHYLEFKELRQKQIGKLAKLSQESIEEKRNQFAKLAKAADRLYITSQEALDNCIPALGNDFIELLKQGRCPDQNRFDNKLAQFERFIVACVGKEHAKDYLTAFYQELTGPSLLNSDWHTLMGHGRAVKLVERAQEFIPEAVDSYFKGFFTSFESKVPEDKILADTITNLEHKLKFIKTCEIYLADKKSQNLVEALCKVLAIPQKQFATIPLGELQGKVEQKIADIKDPKSTYQQSVKALANIKEILSNAEELKKCSEAKINKLKGKQVVAQAEYEKLHNELNTLEASLVFFKDEIKISSWNQSALDTINKLFGGEIVKQKKLKVRDALNKLAETKEQGNDKLAQTKQKKAANYDKYCKKFAQQLGMEIRSASIAIKSLKRSLPANITDESSRESSLAKLAAKMTTMLDLLSEQVDRGLTNSQFTNTTDNLSGVHKTVFDAIKNYAPIINYSAQTKQLFSFYVSDKEPEEFISDYLKDTIRVGFNEVINVFGLVENSLYDSLVSKNRSQLATIISKFYAKDEKSDATYEAKNQVFQQFQAMLKQHCSAATKFLLSHELVAQAIKILPNSDDVDNQQAKFKLQIKLLKEASSLTAKQLQPEKDHGRLQAAAMLYEKYVELGQQLDKFIDPDLTENDVTDDEFISLSYTQGNETAVISEMIEKGKKTCLSIIGQSLLRILDEETKTILIENFNLSPQEQDPSMFISNLLDDDRSTLALVCNRLATRLDEEDYKHIAEGRMVYNFIESILNKHTLKIEEQAKQYEENRAKKTDLDSIASVSSSYSSIASIMILEGHFGLSPKVSYANSTTGTPVTPTTPESSPDNSQQSSKTGIKARFVSLFGRRSPTTSSPTSETNGDLTSSDDLSSSANSLKS